MEQSYKDYRVKPREVEAMQFTGAEVNVAEIIDWFGDDLQSYEITRRVSPKDLNDRTGTSPMETWTYLKIELRKDFSGRNGLYLHNGNFIVKDEGILEKYPNDTPWKTYSQKEFEYFFEPNTWDFNPVATLPVR